MNWWEWFLVVSFGFTFGLIVLSGIVCLLEYIGDRIEQHYDKKRLDKKN